MAENFNISNGSKEQKYLELIPQIQALVAGEEDLIANLANITAALQMSFNWLWVGFYLVKDNELVLGPFQGPVACTRIQYGKGVCGTAWAMKEVQVIPDVNKFPGHIACSALAKSEIVLPVYNTNLDIVAVLDIDSLNYNTFDNIDKHYLELLLKVIMF